MPQPLSKLSGCIIALLWLMCDLAATEPTEQILANIIEELELNPSDYDPSGEWVVEIIGGQVEADRIAGENGFDNKGLVKGFEHIYIFSQQPHSSRSKRSSHHYTKRLTVDKRVTWAEHQSVKRRTKRDYRRVLRPINTDLMFNDPLWPKQWPLHDTRTMRDLPKLDLHVIGAWKKGYTGKGVVISILDDGIQWDHPDLFGNYDPEASFDLNDNDTDPMPTLNDDNRHGTRCAGEVSMIANNNICGVGVAYNSRIGGIRMLDGNITDRLEAEALQFHINHVDIFSASWGPNDDGKTVEGPGTLASKAIENGIKNGRKGRGTIYIWASGNGGMLEDNCDCDGYTNSIFTFSVSSASQSGRSPYYAEACASTITTTYSSGAFSDQRITTVDLNDTCTTEHTGTSASAPLAAGIVALALEANPELTWRDVQHIAVWTAEPAPLLQNPGWHKNGVGLMAHTRFGFGLMNAESFVSMAESWKNVPTQRICSTSFPKLKVRKLNTGKPVAFKLRTDACVGQVNFVKYLEHLELVVDIDYTNRGKLEIFLTSPAGTKTQLLTTRGKDTSKFGFKRWPFMSVHTWGENPSGWWMLEITDSLPTVTNSSQPQVESGAVNTVSMVLYGTSEAPEHYSKQRSYNMEYNRIWNRAAPLPIMKY